LAPYGDHIERTGVELFRLACDQDLEGVVAKARLVRTVLVEDQESNLLSVRGAARDV